MSQIQAAIYARVSRQQQVDAGTIASQVAEFRERAVADGLAVSDELELVELGRGAGAGHSRGGTVRGGPRAA